MKKSIKIVLITFLLLANSGFLFSQELWLELGDKYFDQYAYDKAIKLYKGAIERGINNWEINAKLGDCYYNTSRPNEAINKYEIALESMPISEFTNHYRLNYALSVMSINDDCKKAIDEIKKSKNSGKTLLVLAKYFIPNFNQNEIPENFEALICENEKSIKSDVLLENFLSLNTGFSDFGVYISGDIMYYASSKKIQGKRKHNKRLYNWNNQPYLDIYDTIISGNTANSKLPDLSEINDIGHESSVTISNDGKTMYYSGSNVENHKLQYNNRGTSNLKIKRARLINNKWVKDSDSKDLEKINLENYSVGNPAFSPDNKKLFFITCAPYPDAKGQSDIYYVNLDNDLNINGKPINLEAVNTMGRESFPFISNDTILYFSSDGIYKDVPAMGLLDIYSYDLKTEGDSVKVKTLGNAFNSDKDDFAYSERFLPESSEYSKEGFFSSNRDKFYFEGDTIYPKGSDDIYRFKSKKCKRTIKGTIKDSITGEILEKAMVKLINSEGKQMDSIKVDVTGHYSFDVKCNQKYNLRGSKELYYDALVRGLDSESESTDISLRLKPFPCKITIYHEYKFSTIDSIDLQNKNLKPVLDFLIANPEVKIKIKSYTDSRGSYEYNLKELSKERAEASKAYLIKEGVKESQILSVEGFGEDYPVISDEEIEKLNSDEEKEKAHQKNRRSIFLIDYANGLKECEDIGPND